MFLGKTVTFVEFPEKRQAMDVPAGSPLRGDNLKGKHVQGALFARTKDRYFRRG